MSWQILVPTILLAAAALTGILCLAIVGYWWQTIGSVIPETWPKIVVEIVQTISGIASIGAAFATAADEKGNWLLAAIFGCISLFVWKVLQLLLDNRTKAWEKVEKATLRRAQDESESRTRLLTLFREFVVKKVRRLSKALDRGAHLRKPKIRATLVPDAHLDDILLSIAVYFSSKLPDDQARTRNFRVGLYIDENGFMKPLRAVDSNHGDYNVFSSFESHRDRFSLADASDNSSHVVQCVRLHKTIIVEDCLEAAKEGKSFLF